MSEQESRELKEHWSVTLVPHRAGTQGFHNMVTFDFESELDASTFAEAAETAAGVGNIRVHGERWRDE